MQLRSRQVYIYDNGGEVYVFATIYTPTHMCVCVGVGECVCEYVWAWLAYIYVYSHPIHIWLSIIAIYIRARFPLIAYVWMCLHFSWLKCEGVEKVAKIIHSYVCLTRRCLCVCVWIYAKNKYDDRLQITFSSFKCVNTWCLMVWSLPMIKHEFGWAYTFIIVCFCILLLCTPLQFCHWKVFCACGWLWF